MLGQLDSAVSWLSVVQTPDYYNCGLSTTTAYPSSSTAFSGTGFIGFSSYGNMNGSSEAVGQYLSRPLLPEHPYTFSFSAKKPYAGLYSYTCGGVALYGFQSNMPLDTYTVHLSQFSNAQLLGISLPVQDTAWQSFSFDFTPSDSVNALALTVQHAIHCTECIFLDALSLISTGISIDAPGKPSELKVFPNPFTDQLTFALERQEPIFIYLYDFWGRPILQQEFTNSTTINTEQLANGFYLYKLGNDKETIAFGTVVKQ